jgi:hypothetical protein
MIIGQSDINQTATNLHTTQKEDTVSQRQMTSWTIAGSLSLVNCESRICWLKTITLRTKVDFRLMITMLLLVSYIPNVCVGVFFILFYIFTDMCV